MTSKSQKSILRPFTPPPPPPPPSGAKNSQNGPTPFPRSRRTSSRASADPPISATPFDALSHREMAKSPERTALMADIRSQPKLRHLDKSEIRDLSSPFPVTGHLDSGTSSPSPPTSRPSTASPHPTRPSTPGVRFARSRERSSFRQFASSRSDLLSPVRSPSRADYTPILPLYPSVAKFIREGAAEQNSGRPASVTPTPQSRGSTPAVKGWNSAPKPSVQDSGIHKQVEPSAGNQPREHQPREHGASRNGSRWEMYEEKSLYAAELTKSANRSRSYFGPRQPTFFETAVKDVFSDQKKNSQTVTRKKRPAPPPPQVTNSDYSVMATRDGIVHSYKANGILKGDLETRFALRLDLEIELMTPPTYQGKPKTYPSLQKFLDDSVL